MTANIHMGRGVLIAAMSFVACARAGEIADLTAKFPELDPPPNGEAQWVARSMRLNGLPMTIKAFKTSTSVEDVIYFYERWWHGKGKADYQRSQRGEWRMLGIKSDKHFISIQARRTLGGSEGTIAVSTTPDAVKRMATKFPHPTSTSVVALQEYDDFGMESEHITMLSSRAATVEARDFARMLQAQGWHLVLDAKSKTSQGHTLEAQRDAEHAQISFLPGRELGATTAVTVVWKKS